jgi:hypothetical protein
MMKLILVAAIVATALATCSNPVCRCKTGSTEVRNYDSNGCYTCFCQANDSTTAAPTTARATSIAPTTARATTVVPTTARASTVAPTTARASTVAVTTARATTVAPTTARCGAIPSCSCSSGSIITWATDARGCPSSCNCGPSASTVAASTKAASTVRLTSAAPTCPAAQPCQCFRKTDVQTWVSDGNGCRSCVCVAAPESSVAPATTPRETTAVPSCAPLELRDNCNCGDGSVKYYRTDAWGCVVCGCKAVPTTIVPTTTARPTTARTTTAATRAAASSTVAVATTARATTARATTAGTTPLASCGVATPCRCRSDAVVVWQADSNGCPVCYCSAVGSAATGEEAGSSVGSGSESSTPSYVPVVVAMVCLFVGLVGVAAVARYRIAHGRFPWAKSEQAATPIAIQSAV